VLAEHLHCIVTLAEEDDDQVRYMDYAPFNPVKHGHVIFARDWPHSTFCRFVRTGPYPADWGAGNLDDVPVGEPRCRVGLVGRTEWCLRGRPAAQTAACARLAAMEPAG
jgi:hypothetical protein